MIHFHQVRVFCDADNRFGEAHAMILDEDSALDRLMRQKIATRLGFDETIFINNLAAGDTTFFDTTKEVPFAGTAALAAAWFINQRHGQPITTLAVGEKTISTWQEDGRTWVSTKFDTMPSWHHVQYTSPELIARITPEEAEKLEHTMLWAWQDEAAGRIRARTFASDWDIPEVEANGSGSMMLAARLGKPLTIHHGRGSIIHIKPLPEGHIALGGRVIEDEEPDLTT